MGSKYVQVTCPQKAQALLHAGLLLYYWKGDYGTCSRGASPPSDKAELANITNNLRANKWYYVLVEDDSDG